MIGLNKLISIIVPVYNVDKYLDRCIESIRNQTIKNLEIILVDDGSTDNSSAICDSYAKIDKRIKVIHKENGGISSARNKGLECASGDYIGFVDSDDYISSVMYEYLYELLVNNKASVSCVREILVNEDEEVTFDDKMKDAIVMNNKDALKELLKGKVVNDFVWNKLYRRELFNDIRFPLDRKYEDLATTYKIIRKSNRVVYSDIKLYAYVKRENSATNNFKRDNFIDYHDMVIERYNDLLVNNSDLLDYIDASMIVSIVSEFKNISMFNRKDMLMDKEIGNLLDKSLSKLKDINNKNVRKINNRETNFLVFILCINPKLFYLITGLFYKLKNR